MFKLIIFLDDYEEPIIVPLVTEFKHGIMHGDKVITFEYKPINGSSDAPIRKGVFFINKIKGYTIYDIDADHKDEFKTNEPIIGGN